MPDLRKLKDRAADHFRKGRFARAAEVLEEVARADPRDVAPRQNLAEALRRSGDAPGAQRVYEQVADWYAKDGQLLKAIAIAKVILEISPGHRQTQERLAELYARKKGAAPARRPEAAPAGEGEERVELPLSPPAAARDQAALASASTPFEAILEAAREGQAEEGEVSILVDLPEAEPAARPASVPEAEPAAEVFSALPRIPLFSDLPADAFVALAGRVVLHRAPPGAVLVAQGDTGTSFFALSSGRVRVERADAEGQPLPLAVLLPGSFFGEMALLSGEPRAASVVAEDPVEVLEIRADVLLELAREQPQVVASLGRFYRRRLLANAMALSPLFRPFNRDERAAIMGRFRTREVQAGTEVIAEGQPSDGLYVVLSGGLEVWKRRQGGPALAARLREGDLFGEMSCLRKGPASATVTAARRSVLLRLPRSEFDELVMSYPQILELVADLGDERQHSLEAVAAGQAEYGEEGLLLT